MFIRYQKVRNRVVGALAAVGGVFYAIFGCQSMTNNHQAEPIGTDHIVQGEWDEPSTVPQPAVTDSQTPAEAKRLIQNALVGGRAKESFQQNPTPSPQRETPTANERYHAAMKLAMSHADASGKGKDVLGSSSPWKLNLYDDNKDGTWDRAKLDTNRDEVDDEKWNYKNGRWEKENGQVVWAGGQWVKATRLAKANNQSADPNRVLYRVAIHKASLPADASGKGKDVLGKASSWKLNLYDDDRDGTWDRAKLDTNRDNVDDEKWNLKNGRWEKNGGQMVWSGDQWISVSKQANEIGKSSNPKLARYREAFKIANSKADRSGKGKDVLGRRSPWKLNLYDDNRDGVWDRAKLDTNRDEVDDEKWTFKNGRWEKNSGQMVWIDGNWKSAASFAKAASSSADPNLARYRAAMKIATARAARSGKGKDVLGSRNPWKLNLYDDDKDGIWDRAKLDTNRDEVDDEKWNFKHGRWEKDGGATTWDGQSWVAN